MDEVKFEPFQKVLVRDEDNEKWTIAFFKELSPEDNAPFMCIPGYWKQCLAYEGNEHLFGTTDSPTPPESEFEWGDKVAVEDEDNSSWHRAFFVSKTPSGEFLAVCQGRVVASRHKQCRHFDW